jgi:hypothetical protein
VSAREIGRRLGVARSTVGTVSASAISLITWLIPTPHRLTVYASAAAPLPVAPATLVTTRLATPYPGGTFPRRIALTSPSARRLPIGIGGRTSSESAVSEPNRLIFRPATRQVLRGKENGRRPPTRWLPMGTEFHAQTHRQHHVATVRPLRPSSLIGVQTLSIKPTFGRQTSPIRRPARRPPAYLHSNPTRSPSVYSSTWQSIRICRDTCMIARCSIP